MFKYLNIKLSALRGGKFLLKIAKLYQKFFGEKYLGNIGFNFSKKLNRTEIVQKTINIKKYKTYLEIGTFKDELFSQIQCDYKVGVDPSSGGTIRMTSDNFFLSNTNKFDCIFIDGLHHYEQVKRDIDNSLKVLNEDGIIFIHDCLPNNYAAQAIPRTEIDWNGDVWKALVECRTNQDLDCYTCYADWGIGVIFKRPNKNLLNIKVSDFKELKFEDFFHNYHSYMNIIESEELFRIIEN